MPDQKVIKRALISVFSKEELDTLVSTLHTLGVELYSTGGTQAFIEKLNIPVQKIEDLTGYPSILGGRVKTLHPKVFGGILQRSEENQDQKEIKEFDIPPFDLVVVDLYPFEETVASGAGHDAIIEKIDIGGISLIRAAAKNYKDVVIISDKVQYSPFSGLLQDQSGSTTLDQRKTYAGHAFHVSSHYDTHIHQYFAGEKHYETLKISEASARSLRYGENPHQKGWFYGNMDALFNQLHGKEISYNNIVDIQAACELVQEFEETAFIIIKHTNACGVALGTTVKDAYQKAFAADTVSAFGGVLACNRTIDDEAAEAMNSLFFEILIAPGFGAKALDILKTKKNRILLVQKEQLPVRPIVKSMFNGFLVQDPDHHTDASSDLTSVTKIKPSEEQEKALLFASAICKHTKSNAIVLARNGQMLSSGVGQTSRVDALKQAIEKAKRFDFEIDGCVMASDAFFPFSDTVEIGAKAGVKAIIQPGGSIRDQDSINKCNEMGIAMVFSGVRHFKH